MMDSEGLLSLFNEGEDLQSGVEEPNDVGDHTTFETENEMGKYSDVRTGLTKEEQQDLNDGLMYAVERGTIKNVIGLIEAGADVNYKDKSLYQYTPLLIATYAGQTETVEELIKQGADLNVNSVFSSSALGVAVKKENKEIVEILLKAGANPHIGTLNINEEEKTPLLVYAANSGNKEITKLLLQYCDDDHKSKAYTSHPKAIETMAAAGANPEIRDGRGQTPLMQIIERYFEPWSDNTGKLYDFTEVVENRVKALIKGGADVNAVLDVSGTTPLMYAAHRKAIKVIPLLLEAGADVDAVAHNGGRVLKIAQYNESEDTVVASRKAVTLLKDHYERLDKIAEYIERVGMNGEPSTLTPEERTKFLKDATNFNEDNIASALAKRLATPSISEQMSRGELATEEDAMIVISGYLPKAKEAVQAARKQYKKTLDIEFSNKYIEKTTIYREQEVTSKDGQPQLKQQSITADLTRLVVEYLPPDAKVNAAVAFAREQDYPEAIARAAAKAGAAISAHMPEPPSAVARAGGNNGEPLGGAFPPPPPPTTSKSTGGTPPPPRSGSVKKGSSQGLS